jgi:hypothetical protein
MIIFHRIAWLDDLDALEPRDRPAHRQLHVLGQRGRDAVGVDQMIVKSFWLQENLVPVAVPETMHLVFDRWAIARPHAADLACE